MTLGESGAEPAQERAAAGVREQRGASFALGLAKPVELRVEGVGQIVTEGYGAGDGDGCLDEGSTVTKQKYLPRGFVAQGAGVRKSEFGEMEGSTECCFLGKIGMIALWKAIVDLFADGSQRGAELLKAEAAGFGFGSSPKLVDQARR